MKAITAQVQLADLFILIPNTLVKQTHLENQKLQVEIIKEGLLISPKKNIREGWKESIEATLKEHQHDIQDKEWLDAPLVSNEKWEW